MARARLLSTTVYWPLALATAEPTGSDHEPVLLVARPVKLPVTVKEFVPVTVTAKKLPLRPVTPPATPLIWTWLPVTRLWAVLVLIVAVVGVMPTLLIEPVATICTVAPASDVPRTVGWLLLVTLSVFGMP